MFDMQRIGRKIFEFRKSRNMTQMELADQLGISFQAVSNWERGISMPDISKLPELAEIMDISLDEFLGEKSALVEAAINDKFEEAITRENTTAEDVEAMIPILKPKQINKIIGAVEKSDGKLIPSSFIPYMDADDVKKFALKALEQGERITSYLPFLDKNDIKEFALKTLEEGKGIASYLPFLDKNDVKEFALKTLEEGKSISSYLPFLDKNNVKEFASKTLEEGKGIASYLPFLDKNDVKEFALKTLEQGERITSYLPFLAKEDVKEFFLQML